MLQLWKKTLICTLLCLCLPLAALAKGQEPMMRIGILENQAQVTVSAQNDFVMKVPALKKNYRFPQGKNLAFNYKNGKLLLNNKPLNGQDIIIAVKDKKPVVVNGHPYRGALNLLVNSRGITVVNRVPMEQYLYGVVPAEMPYSWPAEALKAQAVAARTFALNYKNTHGGDGKSFDLCATTSCQVYNGISGEKSSVIQAIDNTKGQILTYGNTPIAAVFHAASGGSTINSEEGWNSSIPYLQGVLEKNEKSPYDSWSKVYTDQQFQSILQKQLPGLKQIKKIDMSQYPRNQVNVKNKKILITDIDNKTYQLTGAAFRSLFNLNSSNFTIEATYPPKSVAKAVNKGSKAVAAAVSAPAANTAANVKKASKVKGNIYQTKSAATAQIDNVTAAVNKIDTAAGLPVKFTIQGSGLGHRIGMSQWGAKGEAETGKNYQAILSHYYTGVKLQQLYD